VASSCCRAVLCLTGTPARYGVATVLTADTVTAAHCGGGGSANQSVSQSEHPLRDRQAGRQSPLIALCTAFCAGRACGDRRACGLRRRQPAAKCGTALHRRRGAARRSSHRRRNPRAAATCAMRQRWHGGTLAAITLASWRTEGSSRAVVQCAVVPWSRPRLAKTGGIRSVIVMDQEYD
jgi:hypothetical protein